jgi:ketosteroid isomerase-like protein
MNTETRNIAVVRRYFDGCNSGDLDVLLSTLAPGVVHYFLPESFPTVRGAEHLAKYWRKWKTNLRPIWHHDEIIGHGDRVVSEWSVLWTPPGKQHQVMSRGSEWYVLRDALILEVRAYFAVNDTADTELADFPYVDRGYLGRSPAKIV